jgi:hypothetical protein
MSSNLALPDSEIAERLFELEKKIDLIIAAMASQGRPTEPDWISPEEFAPLVGLKNGRNVVYHINAGRLQGEDCIFNVGTPERPRYRIHRVNAVNQFLNRG